MKNLGSELSDEIEDLGSNILIDHVVIERIKLRLCVRAPPKLPEEGIGAWLIGKILLDEEELIEGLEIEIPQVVFNGDFIGVDRLDERSEALYMRTITSSSYIARQIFWQILQWAALLRVVGNSALRRRDEFVFNRVESLTLSSKDRGWYQGGSIGLLAALDETSEDITPSDESSTSGAVSYTHLTLPTIYSV